MKRCNCCTTNEADWAMQPCGPEDDPTFATLGSHYRGFVVVPVCDACKTRYQAGGADSTLTFTHKGTAYTAGRYGVRAVKHHPAICKSKAMFGADCPNCDATIAV